MERLRPLIISTACLLALVACGSNSGNRDLPAPAVIATAQAHDCVANLTQDNLNQCATKKDEQIGDLDEIQKIINSPFVDKKYRPMYQQTIETMNEIFVAEKTIPPKSLIEFYELKRQGVFGFNFYGCTENIPFYTLFVFPQKNNDPDDVLATKWHEYEHTSRAYQKYKNGVPCPFKLPTDEKTKVEVEVDYWGGYLQAAARRFGYQSKNRENNIETIGYDPADIVYEVLIPANIDPDGWLYEFIINRLQSRFISVNIWGNLLPFASQDTKDKLKQTESDWKTNLQNATPQEKEAIKQMVKLNLVTPNFFPTLPK